jgi:multidrug transporter EmrE-like cation transporter
MVKRLSLAVAADSLLGQALALLRFPLFYVAGLLYVTCAVLYFLVLNRLPLSAAGPTFMVLGVVTTAIIGVAVFAESINALKLFGILICLGGTALIFYDAAR